MIRVSCSCGKRFRGPDTARGRTIRCTRCGRSITVPADAPAAEGSAGPASAARVKASGVGAEAEALGSVKELWAALRRRALHLDFVPPSEHLRRCMRCALTVFDVPVPCPKCASATVGIRLADVNSGRDRAWLLAVGAIAAARRRLSLFRRAAFVAAALAAAALGAWLASRDVLTFWRGLALGVAALLAAALASWAALVLARRALEVLHPVLRGGPAPDGADERLVAQVEERFLIPFIQRHSVERESADLIPPDELDMLVTLVGRQGLTLRREHIYEFLAACALRGAYQEFKAEFLRFELSDPDTFAVYASLYPEPAADALRLPFLEQYLEEGARRPDPVALRWKIESIRRERKLAAFEAELGKAAPAGGPRAVALEDVDRIAPANFQLLAGLVFQAKGYVVHGMPEAPDRPPVSVAEKDGEKTAVLARLSKGPVGEAPVRDLADARDFFRCRHAVLLTNASFAPSAQAAAAEIRVTLADRDELGRMLAAFNASPREFARLTLILKPWREEGGEELMSFDAVSDAPRARTDGAAPPPAMTYDEADDLMALLKKRAKERETP